MIASISEDGPGPLIVSLCGAVLTFLLLGLPSILARRKFGRMCPDRPFVAEKSYRGAGSSLQPTGRIELNTQGIRIVEPWLFRWLFSSVVIPWSVVSRCRRVRVFFSDVIRLDVSQIPKPVFIGPFLWRDEGALSLIPEYWEKHRSMTSASE